MGVCGVGIGCLAKTSFTLNEQRRTWTIRAPQRADETRQDNPPPSQRKVANKEKRESLLRLSVMIVLKESPQSERERETCNSGRPQVCLGLAFYLTVDFTVSPTKVEKCEWHSLSKMASYLYGLFITKGALTRAVMGKRRRVLISTLLLTVNTCCAGKKDLPQPVLMSIF